MVPSGELRDSNYLGKAICQIEIYQAVPSTGIEIGANLLESERFIRQLQSNGFLSYLCFQQPSRSATSASFTERSPPQFMDCGRSAWLYLRLDLILNDLYAHTSQPTDSR